MSALEKVLLRDGLGSFAYQTCANAIATYYTKVNKPIPAHTLKALRLRSIHFADGGNSSHDASSFAESLLVGSTKSVALKPLPEALPVKEDVDLKDIPKQDNLDGLLDNYNFIRAQGRTLIYQHKTTGKYLALKVLKANENASELTHEHNMFAYFKKHGKAMGLTSDYPTPVTINGKQVVRVAVLSEHALTALQSQTDKTGGVLQIDNRYNHYTVMAYQVDNCDYFTYINDKELNEEQFNRATEKSINDLFVLASHGMIHPALVDIFHTIPKDSDRSMGDQGKYLWMVNIIRSLNSGTGRLKNWFNSVAYPNLRLSGLADLADITTLDELVSDTNHHGSIHLTEARGKFHNNQEALKRIFLANFLGDYLLAIVLITGSRLHKLNQLDVNNPQQLADIIQQAFTQAFAAMRSPEQAAELAKAIDWTRLARQMSYFMSGAYIGDFNPANPNRKVPTGLFEDDIATFGDFDLQCWSDAIGWMGIDANDQVDNQPALGPVNGALPLTEIVKALYVFTALMATGMEVSDEDNTPAPTIADQGVGDEGVTFVGSGVNPVILLLAYLCKRDYKTYLRPDGSTNLQLMWQDTRELYLRVKRAIERWRFRALIRRMSKMEEAYKTACSQEDPWLALDKATKQYQEIVSQVKAAMKHVEANSKAYSVLEKYLEELEKVHQSISDWLIVYAYLIWPRVYIKAKGIFEPKNKKEYEVLHLQAAAVMQKWQAQKQAASDDVKEIIKRQGEIAKLSSDEISQARKKEALNKFVKERLNVNRTQSLWHLKDLFERVTHSEVFTGAEPNSEERAALEQAIAFGFESSTGDKSLRNAAVRQQADILAEGAMLKPGQYGVPVTSVIRQTPRAQGAIEHNVGRDFRRIQRRYSVRRGLVFTLAAFLGAGSLFGVVNAISDSNDVQKNIITQVETHSNASLQQTTISQEEDDSKQDSDKLIAELTNFNFILAQAKDLDKVEEEEKQRELKEKREKLKQLRVEEEQLRQERDKGFQELQAQVKPYELIVPQTQEVPKPKTWHKVEPLDSKTTDVTQLELKDKKVVPQELTKNLSPENIGMGSANQDISGDVFAQVEGGGMEYLLQVSFSKIDPILGVKIPSSPDVIHWRLSGKAEKWVVMSPQPNRLLVPSGYVIADIQTENKVDDVRVYFDRANKIWHLHTSADTGAVRIGVRKAQTGELPEIKPFEIVGNNVGDSLPPEIKRILEKAKSLPLEQRKKVKEKILKLFYYSTNPNLKPAGNALKSMFENYAMQCDGFAVVDAILLSELDIKAEVHSGYRSEPSGNVNGIRHSWIWTEEGVGESVAFSENASPLYGKQGVTDEDWQKEFDFIKARAEQIKINLAAILEGLELEFEIEKDRANGVNMPKEKYYKLLNAFYSKRLRILHTTKLTREQALRLIETNIPLALTNIKDKYQLMAFGNYLFGVIAEVERQFPDIDTTEAKQVVMKFINNFKNEKKPTQTLFLSDDFVPSSFVPSSEKLLSGDDSGEECWELFEPYDIPHSGRNAVLNDLVIEDGYVVDLITGRKIKIGEQTKIHTYNQGRVAVKSDNKVYLFGEGTEQYRGQGFLNIALYSSAMPDNWLAVVRYNEGKEYQFNRLGFIGPLAEKAGLSDQRFSGIKDIRITPSGGWLAVVEHRISDNDPNPEYSFVGLIAEKVKLTEARYKEITSLFVFPDETWVAAIELGNGKYKLIGPAAGSYINAEYSEYLEVYAVADGTWLAVLSPILGGGYQLFGPSVKEPTDSYKSVQISTEQGKLVAIVGEEIRISNKVVQIPYTSMRILKIDKNGINDLGISIFEGVSNLAVIFASNKLVFFKFFNKDKWIAATVENEGQANQSYRFFGPLADNSFNGNMDAKSYQAKREWIERISYHSNGESTSMVAGEGHWHNFRQAVAGRYGVVDNFETDIRKDRFDLRWENLDKILKEKLGEDEASSAYIVFILKDMLKSDNLKYFDFDRTVEIIDRNLEFFVDAVNGALTNDEIVNLIHFFSKHRIGLEILIQLVTINSERSKTILHRLGQEKIREMFDVYEASQREKFGITTSVYPAYYYNQEARKAIEQLNSLVPQTGNVGPYEDALKEAERKLFVVGLDSPDANLSQGDLERIFQGLHRYLETRTGSSGFAFDVELSADTRSDTLFKAIKLLQANAEACKIRSLSPVEAANKEASLREWQAINDKLNEILGPEFSGQKTIDSLWVEFWKEANQDGLFLLFLIGLLHFALSFMSDYLRRKDLILGASANDVINKIWQDNPWFGGELGNARKLLAELMLANKELSNEEQGRIENLRKRLQGRERVIFDCVRAIALESPKEANPKLARRLLSLIPAVSLLLVRSKLEHRQRQKMNKQIRSLVEEISSGDITAPKQAYSRLEAIIKSFDSQSQQRAQSGSLVSVGDSLSLAQKIEQGLSRGTKVIPPVTNGHLRLSGKSGRRSGRGSEYHQSRHYQYGDSPRDIDWKKTARQSPDKPPAVKEYQEEYEDGISLLLDFRSLGSQDNFEPWIHSFINSILVQFKNRCVGRSNYHYCLNRLIFVLPDGSIVSEKVTLPHKTSLNLMGLAKVIIPRVLARWNKARASFAGQDTTQINLEFYDDAENQRYSQRTKSITGSSNIIDSERLTEFGHEFAQIRGQDLYCIGLDDDLRLGLAQLLPNHRVRGFHWLANRALALTQSANLSPNITIEDIGELAMQYPRPSGRTQEPAPTEAAHGGIDLSLIQITLVS
ncbi:MAG: DUF58 domain-containing protein [Candidatus Omnitrophota bacterium]